VKAHLLRGVCLLLRRARCAGLVGLGATIESRTVRIAAVTAAVAAVLAVIALLVTTYRNATGDDVARQGTSGPVAGTPAPAGPDTPSPSTAPTPPADDAAAAYEPDAKTKAAIRDVTVRFLDEWKRPGTAKTRTKRIGPYATEWLTKRLADVDPADLPTSHIIGTPTIVAASPYAAGTVTRFDDGLRIRCNLVLDTSGWRVAEVLPDTEGPPPKPTGKPGASRTSRTPTASPTPTPSTTDRKAP
jgi:hypothetical protein